MAHGTADFSLAVLCAWWVRMDKSSACKNPRLVEIKSTFVMKSTYVRDSRIFCCCVFKVDQLVRRFVSTQKLRVDFCINGSNFSIPIKNWGVWGVLYELSYNCTETYFIYIAQLSRVFTIWLCSQYYLVDVTLYRSISEMKSPRDL